MLLTSFQSQPSGGAMRYPELLEAAASLIAEVGMSDRVDLGCESGAQNRLNRAQMDSLSLRTRILGAVPATTATELFGARLSLPIVASALCASRILEAIAAASAGGTLSRPLPWDGDYLEAIAGGLADAGTAMSTGYISEEQLARVVDCGAPVIHIVKPHRDNEWVLRQLERAEQLGCVAVGMDIDSSFKEKAHDEVPAPAELTHKTLEEMSQFIAATSLPFVMKGVLSAEDAVVARDLGAAAVMVSLHGGEVIDHARPVLEALREVRGAVPELVVLADSGFRRGADVVKALALGASAVGIGTLLVLACAANGRAGVRDLLAVLEEELGRTMSYLGCPDVRSIDEGVLAGAR